MVIFHVESLKLTLFCALYSSNLWLIPHQKMLSMHLFLQINGIMLFWYMRNVIGKNNEYNGLVVVTQKISIFNE